MLCVCSTCHLQRGIRTRSLPDVNKVIKQVSIDGGDSPLWSPDGHELFFRGGDSFMAVDVETEPALGLGMPKALFSC